MTCPTCRTSLSKCPTCAELQCACIGAAIGMRQHWKDGKPRDYPAQKNALLFSQHEVQAWQPRL